MTTESLGREGYIIHQMEDGFRFGTDSVLLGWFASSFIREGKPSAMLELGSNCGAVTLLCAARQKSVSIDSVEIMPEAYELLRTNIEENHLEQRISAFNADLRDLPPEIRRKQYDVVFFNPPFFSSSKGPSSLRKGDGGTRLAGRFEENGTLDDFIRVAASRVRQSSGHIVLINHGSRLAETIAVMQEYKVKPRKLMCVHPFADREASMFLLEGRKGASGNDMTVLPPLILNEKDGNGDIIVTKSITDIYEKEHTTCFI